MSVGKIPKEIESNRRCPINEGIRGQRKLARERSKCRMRLRHKIFIASHDSGWVVRPLI
jgi:hypothetical protein